MDGLFPEIPEETKPKSRSGHGGPRPNSGRKSKAIAALRDSFVADKQGCAEYAFKLYDQTLRDESAPLDLRLECGQEVMNRVWGRPKQAIEHSGEDGGPILIEFVNDWRGQPADGAEGPAPLPPPGPADRQEAGQEV